jgi:hypothetical protein
MLRNIALATLLTLSSAAFAACSDEPDVIQPKPGGSGGGGGGGSSGSKAGTGGAGGKAGSGAAGSTEQDAGNENDAG